MNISILNMKRFEENDKAIDVALPVIAVECEATPPLQNYLDAYEDAVLRFISIGLSTNGIAKAMNATESLIEEILSSLENKEYAIKTPGDPWKLTEAGNDYLDGNISERESKNSQFGYMFINAIKKEVLPFFYLGDINKISLYKGAQLPLKLTLKGSDDVTFSNVNVKRSKLRDAYKTYFRNQNTLETFDEGDITLEEAIDLFEDLDAFDEAPEEEIDSIEDNNTGSSGKLSKNMFIRPLNNAQKKYFLRMRIIIDPRVPGGYKVESPFDFNGLDNGLFLRQIQWLSATGTTFIYGEELSKYLEREIRKISPSFKDKEKDYDVFVLERLPLLGLYKNRFNDIYEDMSRIYVLMQNQNSLIEKENIVSNISRSVVESLFDSFFTNIEPKTLIRIAKNATNDLSKLDKSQYKQLILKKTNLNCNNIEWNWHFMNNSIGRMNSTRGNSILEKFINLVVMNYYLGSVESDKFLRCDNIQHLYTLTDKLNQIRRKVSHNTEKRFEVSDYNYYMANIFEIVNALLAAYRED